MGDDLNISKHLAEHAVLNIKNLLPLANTWPAIQTFLGSPTSIIMSDRLVHAGDLTTRIQFAPSDIRIIAGNILYFQFSAPALSPVIQLNPNQVDMDLKYEGTNDENLLYGNAGTNRMGIGTNAPQEKLDVSGNVFTDGHVEAKNQYACLTLTAGSQIAIAQNTWIGIEWDGQVRVDAIYDHTAGNSGLGIASNGSYMIHCDVSTDTPGNANRNISKMRLLQNTSEIDSTLAFIYNRVAADGEGTASVNIIKNFTSGDNLHVQFTKHDSTAGSILTIPKACRLNITKI